MKAEASFAKREFICPHCDVLAPQKWSRLLANPNYWSDDDLYGMNAFADKLSNDWAVSKCDHCGEVTVWYKKKILQTS